MVYFWAAIAALVAVGLEFYFRRGGPFLPAVWWILPGNLLISYSLSRLFTGNGQWLPLAALFGLMTLGIRTTLSLVVLREPITVPVIVAIGALLGSAVVRQLWH